MSPTLEQALHLIREDRPEAVDQALALLQNTVYSFGMKVCGHPEDAEDTMQDVLVRLLPYLPKFESPQALSVGLYKVARNRCLMNRRGQKNSRGKTCFARRVDAQPYELRELIESKEPNPEKRVAKRAGPGGARGGAENRSAVPNGSGVARQGGTKHRRVCTRHRPAGSNGTGAGASGAAHAAPAPGAQGQSQRRSANPRSSRGAAQALAPLPPDVCVAVDYMDGLVKDVRYRDMEKHLHECQPCVAFLDSLMSAVEQCRTYQPSCDIESATKPRKVLVEKYQAAVAALPKARA